MQNNVSEDTN